MVERAHKLSEELVHVHKLSEELVVRRRSSIQKAANATGRMIKFAIVWFTFRTWAAVVRLKPYPMWHPVSGPITKAMVAKYDSLRRALTNVRELLKDAVQRDYASFCDQKASSLANAALSANTGELYRILRSMKPWVPSRQMRLAADNGEVADSYFAERVLVQEHFGKVLHAERTSFELMLDEDRAVAPARVVQRASMDLDFSVVPT